MRALPRMHEHREQRRAQHDLGRRRSPGRSRSSSAATPAEAVPAEREPDQRPEDRSRRSPPGTADLERDPERLVRSGMTRQFAPPVQRAAGELRRSDGSPGMSLKPNRIITKIGIARYRIISDRVHGQDEPGPPLVGASCACGGSARRRPRAAAIVDRRSHAAPAAERRRPRCRAPARRSAATDEHARAIRMTDSAAASG